MNVENALYPTQERIADLMRDDGKPIVMLNLLRFRAKAAYADGRESGLSGREAYAVYGDAVKELVTRIGGRMLFTGSVKSLAIGSVGEMWDVVALVEYPSSAAFAKMAMSPELAEIGVHRAAGLEGQLLIRVDQMP